jgi:Flp pilus assembly protein TadG
MSLHASPQSGTRTDARPSPPLRRPARDLGRCGRGSISVELALVSPVLALLLVGAMDFGRAFHEQLRLANAARAGAQFAIENLGTSEVLTGIVEAALYDGQKSASELTVTASKTCTCPSGGAVVCTTTCSDGLLPRMHVEVTVQRDFELWFKYPGLSSTLALSETATMRAR